MSSISMKWNRKMTAKPWLQKRRNVLKLINLYREKRVLWDRSLARFEDRRARKVAWRDISNRLPCSLDEVKYRMNSLIKTFERERKKEMCPFCSRRDPREVYRSQWYAYNSFDFLWNMRPKPRRTFIGDFNDNSENEDESYRNAVFVKEEPGVFEEEDGVEFDGDGDDDDDSVIVTGGTVAQRETNETEFVGVDSTNYGAYFLAETQLSPPPTEPVKTVKKVTVIRRKRLDEADPICSSTAPTPILDECSTFADHVRTKLEKFDNQNRAIIMHRISNAIFEAEMKKYGGRNDSLSQPEDGYKSVSVSPAPVCTERRWLKPVLCIPKLD